MLNQRIEAIQHEMEKGEKADFSLFRQDISRQTIEHLKSTSKQVEEIETSKPHFSR